jgi:hypothetical protein
MSLQSGSSIKLCVSSRPETTFANKLETFPSISLQDLNYHDIQRYVAKQFEPLGNFKADLIRDVTFQAEGIFLWAVLVCQSLVAGHEAGDDEETMAKRLSIVPSGLEDLFDSMFSKIDELHRKDLSVYFALLRWRKVMLLDNPSADIDMSVALVERMLYRTPFESLQQFVDACKNTHRRIVAQSKGLIQVVRDDLPETCQGWAFKDIATSSARHQFLDEADSENMYECNQSRLQWIHRSAHDCILGDSSGFLTSDMVQFNQSDFGRQILKAFTWLAQYTPALIFYPGSQTPHGPLLGSFTSPIWSATSNTETEIFQALDTIHDAMQSSLYDTGEFVGCPPSKLSSGMVDPTILLDFWRPLAQFDNYWAARFEQIKSSIHSRLICCALLDILLEDVDELPCPRRSEMGILLTEFLLEEYLCESQGKFVTSVGGEDYVCTWASSRHSDGDDDDGDDDDTEMELLIEACLLVNWYSHTGPLEQYRARLFAIFDAKQIFLGAKYNPIVRRLLIGLPL